MANGRIRVYKPKYHNWESGDLTGEADLIGFSGIVTDTAGHPSFLGFLAERGYEADQISGGFVPIKNGLKWRWDRPEVIPEAFLGWHGVEIKPALTEEDLQDLGNLAVAVSDAGSNGVYFEDNRAAMPLGEFGGSVRVIAHKH